MNERIKKLRKTLHLTQQDFAKRIGVKRNTVATYEMGRTDPSSAAVSLICREFNVNEAWLRTGEGSMFLERTREDEIGNLVNQILSGENAEFKRRLISALASLTEKQWNVIAEKAEEIVTGRAAQLPVVDIKAKVRAEAEEFYWKRLKEEGAVADAPTALAVAPPADPESEEYPEYQDMMFAAYGPVGEEFSDADREDIKLFAQMVKERKSQRKRGK